MYSLSMCSWMGIILLYTKTEKVGGSGQVADLLLAEKLAEASHGCSFDSGIESDN